MNQGYRIYVELLRQSIRLDDPVMAAQEAERIINENNIDWDELYDYADTHSVKPQLAHLTERVSNDIIPDMFRRKIGSALQKNLYDQLGSFAEFIKIKQLFHERGIALIPFKGFWLAYNYYGSLADREATDIDLYMHFSDFDQAGELMHSLGYTAETNMPYFGRGELERKSCEYTFNKYEEGRIISIADLHWRMSPGEYSMDITLADLSSQVVSAIMQDLELDVFTPAASLLLTVMHHGGKDHMVKMKQVYDLAVILKKDEAIDWHWVIKEAKRFHILSLLMASVCLASQITGVELPPQIKKMALSSRSVRLANNRYRQIGTMPSEWTTRSFIIRNWAFKIMSRDGAMVKMRLALWFLLKVLAPAMVPRKYHHLFTRRKILSADGSI